MYKEGHQTYGVSAYIVLERFLDFETQNPYIPNFDGFRQKFCAHKTKHFLKFRWLNQTGNGAMGK